MDFFGIGPLEVLLILIVALIVFGPGRLPEIARTLGKTIRAVRKATFDLTAQVTKEFEGEKERLPKQGEQRGIEADESGEQ